MIAELPSGDKRAVSRRKEQYMDRNWLHESAGRFHVELHDRRYTQEFVVRHHRAIRASSDWILGERADNHRER